MRFEVGWTRKVVDCRRRESAGNIRSHDGARKKRQSRVSYVEFFDFWLVCGASRKTSHHEVGPTNCREPRQIHQISNARSPDRGFRPIMLRKCGSRSGRQSHNKVRIKKHVDACTKFPMRLSCPNFGPADSFCSPAVTQEAPPSVVDFHGPKSIDSWQSEISKTWDVVDVHHQRKAQRLHTWEIYPRYASLPHFFLSLGSSIITIRVLTSYNWGSWLCGCAKTQVGMSSFSH